LVGKFRSFIDSPSRLYQEALSEKQAQAWTMGIRENIVGCVTQQKRTLQHLRLMFSDSLRSDFLQAMVDSRELVVVSGMVEAHLVASESSEDDDWSLAPISDTESEEYKGWFTPDSHSSFPVDDQPEKVDSPLLSTIITVFGGEIKQVISQAPNDPLKAVGSGSDFKLVPCTPEEREQFKSTQSANKADVQKLFSGEDRSPDVSVVLYVRSNSGCTSQELTKKFGKGILKIAHNSPRLEFHSDGQNKRWYLRKLFKTDTHDLRDNFTANT